MLFNLKKMLLTVCVVAITSGTWAAPVLVKTDHNIYEYKLDNGLRVVLAPNRKENKIYMNTIYFTGSLNDPQGKSGLAHLLEHLAFKGTVNITENEFQRQLDQFTLSNNASTDYWSTQYLNLVRPDGQSISKILALEAERMDKLVLKEKYIPTEIEIVRREREIRQDQAVSLMIDQVFKAVYGQQSYGRLPIGDLEELKSISLPELQQYYRSYYAPNNAAIVISGQFDTVTVLAKIDQYFSKIPARAIPKAQSQPKPDLSQVKQRHFAIAKGEEFNKVALYLSPMQPQHRQVLEASPALLTMQPSGRLYQNLVQTGISKDVGASTWLTPDYALLFVAASYAPSQDAAKVEQDLIAQTEKATDFTAQDLARVQNADKNTRADVLNHAETIGEILSDYLVNQMSWDQYFIDQQQFDALQVDQLNQVLKQSLLPANRLQVDISPTPESEKKALQAKADDQSLKTSSEAEPPLKDVKTYKKEIKQDNKQAGQLLNEIEKNIQRGQLSSGVRYALYPVATKNDRIYADIKVHFGDEKSLFEKKMLLNALSYLMLRGSEQYSYQEIVDKSIALNGEIAVNPANNGFNIKINARKENFAAYFDFVMQVLKHPQLSQAEFDLFKAQTLQELEQPKTAPAWVSTLGLSRMLERYQPGDFRAHAEPEELKKIVKAMQVAQVRDFYQQFIAMDHAEVAVTGEFDQQSMLNSLEKQLSPWRKQQPYQEIQEQYFDYAAQQQHLLSEQREFGSYRSILNMPIGDQHADMEALIVVNKILGGSQLSSRLAAGLREENALVYGFNCSLQRDANTDLSKLSISANYRPGKSKQVSQVIHQVFADLIKNGVTEQELEAAKADILKKRLNSYKNPINVHAMLNSQLFLQKTMADTQKRNQRFATLTVKDVNQVIVKYLKPEHLVEVSADQYAQPTAAKP